MNGWDRYLSIERDFLVAKEYVSFDLIKTYSDFFSKAVILLGAEIEGCFKQICDGLGKSDAGNMSEYESTILGQYPGIAHLRSHMVESQTVFMPFRDWSEERLVWWSVYTGVKHSVVDHEATMGIALNMLAAYQLLLFVIHMQKALKAGLSGSIETFLLSESPRLLIPQIDLTQGFVGSDSLLHQMFPAIGLMEKLASCSPD